MTTCAEFLEAGWSEHGDQPQRVADRLASSFGLITEPEHVAAYARLLTHVFGEHLGEWQRGTTLLHALRSLPVCDAAGRAALARNVATLKCASGDETGLDALSQEDRACALATAAAACAGRSEFGRAIALYTRALDLAKLGLPAESPAIRALAVGGNNLAAALGEKPVRDAAENAGMLAAARGGLTCWKLAGTWLEEERAEFQLARSLTLAGETSAAVEHANRCLAICERNDAPAFERFFGWFALAAAKRTAGDAAAFDSARASALACWERVPEEERRWCEAERAELSR